MLNSNLNELIAKLHAAQRNGNKTEEIHAYLNLSRYYYNEEDFLKAKINLEKILNINPNFPEINYFLVYNFECLVGPVYSYNNCLSFIT